MDKLRIKNVVSDNAGQSMRKTKKALKTLVCRWIAWSSTCPGM